MSRHAVVGSCVAFIAVAFVSIGASAGCGGQVEQDEHTDSKSEAIAGGLSCSPASSRHSPRRDETFAMDEFWFVNPPSMTYDPGMLVCPGVNNVPNVLVAGFPPTTCTPGRTINHDFAVTGIVATGSSAQGPGVAAHGTGVVNSLNNRELDASGAGRVSGTWHAELANGLGGWDGVYHGTRTVITTAGPNCPDPSQGCWETLADLDGCGTSGEVQGMRIRATADFHELFASFTVHIDAHAWDP